MPSTVSTYLQRIAAKLGMSGTRELRREVGTGSLLARSA